MTDWWTDNTCTNPDLSNYTHVSILNKQTVNPECCRNPTLDDEHSVYSVSVVKCKPLQLLLMCKCFAWLCFYQSAVFYLTKWASMLGHLCLLCANQRMTRIFYNKSRAPFTVVSHWAVAVRGKQHSWVSLQIASKPSVTEASSLLFWASDMLKMLSRVSNLVSI